MTQNESKNKMVAISRPSFRQLADLSESQLQEFTNYLIETVEQPTRGHAHAAYLVSRHLIDTLESPRRLPIRELASSYLNSLLEDRIAAALPNAVILVDNPRRTPWPPTETGLVERMTLRHGDIKAHVEIYISGKAWSNAKELLDEKASKLY